MAISREGLTAIQGGFSQLGGAFSDLAEDRQQRKQAKTLADLQAERLKVSQRGAAVSERQATVAEGSLKLRQTAATEERALQNQQATDKIKTNEAQNALDAFSAIFETSKIFESGGRLEDAIKAFDTHPSVLAAAPAIEAFLAQQAQGDVVGPPGPPGLFRISVDDLVKDDGDRTLEPVLVNTETGERSPVDMAELMEFLSPRIQFLNEKMRISKAFKAGEKKGLASQFFRFPTRGQAFELRPGQAKATEIEFPGLEERPVGRQVRELSPGERLVEIPKEGDPKEIFKAPERGKAAKGKAFLNSAQVISTANAIMADLAPPEGQEATTLSSIRAALKNAKSQADVDRVKANFFGVFGEGGDPAIQRILPPAR